MVVGDGAVVVALGLPSPPSIDEGDWVLRIEPYCLVVVGKRPVFFALVEPSVPPIVECDRVRRIEPYRIVIVGDRAVIVALGVPNFPPIVERQGVLRIEPDRIRAIRQGVTVSPLVALRAANSDGDFTGKAGPVASADTPTIEGVEANSVRASPAPRCSIR
jgi:hypothetical protein